MNVRESRKRIHNFSQVDRYVKEIEEDKAKEGAAKK